MFSDHIRTLREEMKDPKFANYMRTEETQYYSDDTLTADDGVTLTAIQTEDKQKDDNLFRFITSISYYLTSEGVKSIMEKHPMELRAFTTKENIFVDLMTMGLLSDENIGEYLDWLQNLDAFTTEGVWQIRIALVEYIYHPVRDFPALSNRFWLTNFGGIATATCVKREKEDTGFESFPISHFTHTYYDNQVIYGREFYVYVVLILLLCGSLMYNKIG